MATELPKQESFSDYLNNLRSVPANEIAGSAEILRFALMQAMLDALDHERVAQGLSKAELARRSGLDPVTLRRLLTSPKSNPRLETLVAIAYGLGLEIILRPKVGNSPNP